MYRFIYDENSHFPQDINVYIYDYIKKVKAEKPSKVVF